MTRRIPKQTQRLVSVSRPKQARSQQTLEKILEAAESLIQEKGLADASIPEIVRRAGSSVGGFYARFKDKNELLRALEERFFLDVFERIDELADTTRWVGAKLSVIVATCAAELVTIGRTRENLIAAFLHRAVHDEEFKAEALAFRRKVTARASALFLTRRSEMSHPDPEVAVDFGVQLALSYMLQLVLVGEVRIAGRGLSDAELAREIARSFLGYVGVQGAHALATATPALAPHGDPS